MLAIGGLLVSIALLALAAVAPVFRSSSPPRWTTRGWVGELVTLAIVCTLAIGVGYLGAGVIGAVQTGPNYIDLSLLAVVLFATVVVWRALSARQRPAAVEPDAYARAPEAGQADSHGLVTGAAPLAVSATEPVPPPNAA